MNRKKTFLATSALLLLGLSSCKNTTSYYTLKIYVENKDYLDTPTISISKEGVVSCSEIANAKAYILEYLNEGNEESSQVNVESFPYTLDIKESGVFSVRVAALPKEGTLFVQSRFSDYVQYVSPVKNALGAPTNLQVINNNEITFDEVTYARRYQISIGKETFETRENSYKYDFLPGTSYALKVKACLDENPFFSDSEWSEEVSFKYNVDFVKPTDLTVSKMGELSWKCSSYCASTGFSVKAVNKSTSAETILTLLETKADLTSLASGSYAVSVMANSIGDNPGSSYSDEVSFSLEVAQNWDAKKICEEFTSCNSTKAVYKEDGDYASMQCGLGWGGLFTPAFGVDFSKSPILKISYKEIGFGYMGCFYFNNQTALPTYYYQHDLKLQEKAYDVSLAYDMSKNASGGAQAEATGSVSGISALIGFTTNDQTGADDREVAKLKSVRIFYLNV